MGLNWGMTLLMYFQYFAIAGILNTLFFAVFFLKRKQGNAASIYLLIFMVTASFQALLNAFDTRIFFLALPHLSRISWLIPSLFGPLIYLIVRKMTREKEGLGFSDLLHLIPFICYFIFMSDWFFQSAEYKKRLLANFEIHSLQDFGLLNQLSIYLTFVYTLWALKELRAYKKYLEHQFSEIERMRYRWLQQFLYALIAILFISALGFYGRKWAVPFITELYHYNYALVVLMLYWIAYKWAGQSALLGYLNQQTRDEVVPGKKYAKSALDAADIAAIYKDLVRFMQEKKPYLKGDLSLLELSGMLGVKRHDLSRVINENTGHSFYDFVNSYRVSEMVKKINNPGLANRNFLGLALDSGFNSKATFNAAFKRHTGCTPSAYLRKKKYEPVG